MDPLSISLGIAGLVPLVASAIRIVRRHWTGVRGAKEKVETMMTELEALQSNLTSLQSILDSEPHEPGNVASEESSVLTSCSTACRVKLQALIQRLERPRRGKGKMQVLKWPFEEKEHQETLSELRSLTAWMQFSLSIGSYRLLSASSAEVLNILGKQLSHFEELRHNQLELRRDLEERRETLQDQARERQGLLDWLSGLDIHAQHRKVQGDRTENTGSWFLQDEAFLRWRSDEAESRLLWCHGHPGSGKTVLSSLAIDDLSKESSNGFSVAYFYFSYREANAQDPQAVLSCLLRQVAAMLDEIPPELMQMRLSKGNSGMNLSECKQMMAACLAKTERTYFVLDALDECDFLMHRKALLQTLHDLSQLPKTRLLVTSRSHIQDIAKSFDRIPQIIIEAHDEDLEEYLLAELRASPGSDDLDEDLTEKIRSKIKGRAQGMFLLAVLQLRFIVNEPTPGEMEDALENMSGDLNAAFEGTISRVESLPKSRAQLGMAVLMWLCHARRVMSTAELSDALAFSKAQGSKLDKYRPSTNMMLECCQGLVVLSADTAYIELAHYSIQEYLESNTSRLFPSFDHAMASTCLGYLILDVFKQGPENIHDESGSINYDLIKTRLVNYPLASYATRFWDHHIKHPQALESSWSLLLDFVYDTRSIGSSIQIVYFKRRLRSIYVDPRECLSRTPIHHASAFGLEILLSTLLESPDASSTVNCKTAIVGSTPIILAAASGHTSLVKLLLQHGADPYIVNWYGNALHCAAEADQAETIIELVRYGMNPNYCEEYNKPGSRRSPILCTLDRDSVNALIALIKFGASVNLVGNSSQQPFLHRAATRGASKIVEYLVRNNLVDVHSKSRTGETALDCAIASRSTETIRTLMSVSAGSQQISSRSLAMLARLGFQLKSALLAEAERDEENPAEH